MIFFEQYVQVLRRRLSLADCSQQAWLKLLNNENIGLEILAVLLGLPYGLTIWS